MWNSTELEAPPVNTFKTKSLSIDIARLTAILNNSIKLYNSEEILKTEMTLLFQCVYRLKLALRNDKGFKLMEKTAKVLQKLIKFDITSNLKSFLDTLPTKYEKHIYLPTRQMLEYLLVRLQGFSKLTYRVAECSKHVATLMTQRLYLGHLWKEAAIILAVASRIWYITKIFTDKCCLLYNTLLSLRDNFEINGMKWLPDDYIFPNDLVQWLNVSWMHKKINVAVPVHLKMPTYNLLDDSDEEVEFCHQFQMDDCYIINDDEVINNEVKGDCKKRDVKYKIEDDASLILIDDDDSSCDIEESINSIIEMDANIGESSKTIDIGGPPKKRIKLDKKLFENSIINIDEDVDELVSTKITIISSDDEIQTKKKKKQKKKQKKLHLQSLNPDVKLPTLNTLKDLQKFLKREHRKRRKHPEECLTKRIADERWLQLYYQMSAIKVNAEVNPMKIKSVLLRVKHILQNALQEVS